MLKSNKKSKNLLNANIVMSILSMIMELQNVGTSLFFRPYIIFNL